MKHRNFLVTITVRIEPLSFKEDVKDAGWHNAMQKQICALEDNGTWSMEILPPKKKALGSKWLVFSFFGNHQVGGIDYNETFAHVAKMVIVRAFLAIVASKNWELHQIDVHNYFMHGDLDEEGSVHINVLVYVDDLIIFGINSASLKTFKGYPSSYFNTNDLGVLKYFLGIEVAHSSLGIFICPRKYTLDIISETSFLGAKPAGSPIEQNRRLAHATRTVLTKDS
ncbi:Retrovirus-related Pol polyprotein from transposon TNT 1-94 [Gossypium australe]|uniref:Retrovirus-related Pol polyprotein from transposon TNT 1-94 n=1 Tax=Gossypium australe TaxID=47621 RepID=A0A5B6VKF3_9ROSI|nr:Retrovirus-related Pol polyprotein from transposon TNT 1-94 [Gossypium australe]